LQTKGFSNLNISRATSDQQSEITTPSDSNTVIPNSSSSQSITSTTSTNQPSQPASTSSSATSSSLATTTLSQDTCHTNPSLASASDSIQIQHAQLAQGLPPNWEVRFDKYNRPYYLDHNTQQTTWQRPVPMPVDNDLPPNWERRLDSKNRPYYIDHNTRTTTWFRPTINSMANYQNWQNQRQENQSEQYMNLKNRHLFNGTVLSEENGASGSSNPAVASNTVAGDLPEGWEMRLDINNKTYYVNHKNHTTQWEDPRTQGSEVAMLLEGWEIRYTEKGERLFIDHINKRTTFEDPRGKLTYERDFKWKISKFRYLCQTNTFQGHVKVQVSRTNLFDDSYNQIMKLHPYDLRRKLFLTFKGEEGLDYGGVAREWFFLLSHEVLNPNYCLFQYTSNLCLQINQGSFINPDHIDYFRFIGRFIAMVNKLV